MRNIFTRSVRKWIYAVAAAAVPVLVYFGLLDIEASPIILPFILALLNLTPEEPDYGDSEG